MAATASAGGSGGRKGGGLLPKIPDGPPGGGHDDDDDPAHPDRIFCEVCNKYLRVGQTLAKHRKKSCVGPRGFAGDFVCRFPGCGSRYRHYWDLQAHWKKIHPGAKQPASMRSYVP
jgi:hypothetical protein